MEYTAHLKFSFSSWVFDARREKITSTGVRTHNSLAWPNKIPASSIPSWILLASPRRDFEIQGGSTFTLHTYIYTILHTQNSRAPPSKSTVSSISGLVLLASSRRDFEIQGGPTFTLHHSVSCNGDIAPP